MQLWAELETQLRARQTQELRRVLQRVPEGALDLSSNDYLGLAHHPAVIEAAQHAASRFGTGARASRLVAGHFALIEELETELARFKGAEAALVFSSGYAANVGVLTALSDERTALWCHKRNHASLLDGCRLAQSGGASLRFFESKRKLAALLERSTAPRQIIVVDGVFSMDGDTCDLPAILDLARQFDALVLLDDAHGTGTLGATGRGTAEHFGLRDERLVTLGTLSKALGSQGGWVAGPRVLVDFLLGAARSFLYSTGLNPPAVGAALQSLQLLARQPERVQSCRANARFLADQLREAGFDVALQPAPIVPLKIGEAARALEVSARLQSAGLWCPAIRPPTVPVGSARLRFTARANWSDEEKNRIAQALQLALRP